MSPDEVKLMRFLSTSGSQPLINIKLVVNEQGHFRVTHRHISLIGIRAGCEHPPLAANYLDNLARPGLVSIQERFITRDEVCAEIEDFPQIKRIREGLGKNEGCRVEIDRLLMEVTDLGKQLIRACVMGKAARDRS